MPSRARITQLVARGHSYEEIARELGVPAGQAYMIATGLPADGDGTPTEEQQRERPLLPGSSQHLVNPGAHNPTRNPVVAGWVRGRAARDLTPGT
jgi:transposase-like protein